MKLFSKKSRRRLVWTGVLSFLGFSLLALYKFPSEDVAGILTAIGGSHTAAFGGLWVYLWKREKKNDQCST